MNSLPILFISFLIGWVALMSIIGHRKYATYTERQESSLNTKRFIQSFPIVFGFAIITTICFLFFIITSPSNIRDLSNIGLKHLIPLFIMLALMLPISINNYSNASPELKKKKPLLLLSVLLIVLSDSVKLTILILSFLKL